jgi:phage regulator Rha-like protein
MKKTLITSLFAIILITNQLNAQEKPKTNEELVAEFMQLEEKTKNQKIQIKEQENEIKVLDKLEKTVDEVAKTLGVDK